MRRWRLQETDEFGLFLVLALTVACVSPGEVATPRETPEPAHELTGPTVSHVVYVPVYSTVSLGIPSRPRPTAISAPDAPEAALAATLSIRNTSPWHPIVVDSVKYHDSAGRFVRGYVNEPRPLAPLATVEFVIEKWDLEGGTGASFLVAWRGPEGVDEPMIETVMIGHGGGMSVAFTGTGRAIQGEPGP